MLPFPWKDPSQPDPRHILPQPDVVSFDDAGTNPVSYVWRTNVSSRAMDNRNIGNAIHPMLRERSDVGATDSDDELGEVQPKIELRPMQELKGKTFVKALYESYNTMSQMYLKVPRFVYKDVNPNNLLYYWPQDQDSKKSRGVLHDFSLSMRQGLDMGEWSNAFYKSHRVMVKCLDREVYHLAVRNVMGSKRGRIVVHINTEEKLVQRGPGYIVIPVVSATRSPLSGKSLLNFPLNAKISVPSTSPDRPYLPELRALCLATLVADLVEGTKRFIGRHVPVLFGAGKWQSNNASAFATSQKIFSSSLVTLPLDVLVSQTALPIASVADKVRGQVFRECFLCHWAFWHLGIYHYGVRTENLSASLDGHGIITGFDRLITQVEDYTPQPSQLTRIPFNAPIVQQQSADGHSFEDSFHSDQVSFALTLLWITSRYSDGILVTSEAYNDWSNAYDPQASGDAKLNSMEGISTLTALHGESKAEIEQICKAARETVREQWKEHKETVSGRGPPKQSFTQAGLLRALGRIARPSVLEDGLDTQAVDQGRDMIPDDIENKVEVVLRQLSLVI